MSANYDIIFTDAGWKALRDIKKGELVVAYMPDVNIIVPPKQSEFEIDNPKLQKLVDEGTIIRSRDGLPRTMTKEQLEGSVVKNYSDRDGSKSYEK